MNFRVIVHEPYSDSTGTLVWYHSSFGALALARMHNCDVALNLYHIDKKILRATFTYKDVE